MSDLVDDVSSRYQLQVDRYSSLSEQLARRDWNFSIGRGIVFAVGIVCAILAWNEAFSWWFLTVPVVVFLVLAMQHEQTLQRLGEARALERIYKHHVARFQRRWSDVPVPHVDVPAEHAAIARDLDVTGRGSLFQWLCVAHTPMGRDTLCDWLLNPASSEDIVERQRRVRALAAEDSWRESLQLHGSLLEATSASTTGFVNWATGPTWFATRGWLKWTSRIIPLAGLAVALATVFTTVPLVPGLTILATLLLANLVLCVVYSGPIHEIFLTVAGRSNQARHYRSMLNVATQLPDRVGAVEFQGADLRTLAQQGIEGLARLDRILTVISSSQTFLFGIIHLILQIVILWEFHLLSWLEVWQRRWGNGAPTWFTALGQLEALASLGTVASEHADWAFPLVDPTTDTLSAVQLGHPLLPNHARVSNDVAVGPPGTFLLVTGSNMSGKSTMLRSIGVNTLLAQAGSVVCAREMRLPPLDVQTSMRVFDSLTDGVSFFLAELIRMKAIVDRAMRSKHEPRRLLYLLDEILQGTNSRERHIAVIRIIGHLVRQGSLGAVSTHDLELATCPELQPHCRVVHFRETIAKNENQRALSFDYLMRPGAAPTTNALVLLDLVGLTANGNEESES